MRMCVFVLSCIQLVATPWTGIHQAPRSTEFPRLESWSGLPFPPPGALPSEGRHAHLWQLRIGRQGFTAAPPTCILSFT